MKIDGYTPVDKDYAMNTGVDFEYALDFGTIHIHSRTLNMRFNTKFAMAFKVYQDWVNRRQSLSARAKDKEAEERFLALIYDHGVIRWSTTIKSDGKEIEPNKENFVSLLSHDACRDVSLVYFQDAADDRNFTPEDAEEDAKNSPAPSSGSSIMVDGANNGSEKESLIQQQ